MSRHIHPAEQPDEAIRSRLAETWRRAREASAGDPFGSAMERAAFEVSAAIGAGEIDHAALVAAVRHLTLRTFRARAGRLGRYVGETDPEANTARFREAVRALTRDAAGQPVDIDGFRSRIEAELLGIVLTAHPTFGLSAALTQALAELAAGRKVDGSPLDDEARRAIDALALTERHGFADRPPLRVEEDLAREALVHLRQALERVYRVVLEVAEETYPDHWHRAVPRLLTLATWVGYDLDGRGDIRWSDTFLARLDIELAQIDRALVEVRELVEGARKAGSAGPELTTSLRLVQSRLTLAASTVREDAALLAGNPEDAGTVAHFNRRLVASLESRLIDAAEIVELLGRAIEICPDRELRLRMGVLRGTFANCGLSTAHIHFRVNATQLVNAVRKRVGLPASPLDHRNRRHYLKAISGLLDEVEPVTVNFGSVMAERQTARRVFMLIAQILKHVDSRTPIRFLIAECDNAFVVLAALYFAKLFGVDERLDISPLFETPLALHHGHEIMADLLASPHYRDYVRRRGRICIQTGYSDAGRYLGQVAASLAIERLRIKIVEMLVSHGLTGIELVIFDTHGESIGRGAHPVSFADRLDYVFPPASRASFACAGVPVKHEVSFQGGDGYVFFATPALAFATVCRLLEHSLSFPRDVCDAAERMRREDYVYENTDYSLEFFITAKEFNERVMDEPDYAALLDAFGANLLYPTGSRVVTRHHDGRAAVDRTHPSQMRAIPQNAILQQMGFLANSVGGLGRAIARDPDRFVEMIRGSARARGFMALVKVARDLGDLDVTASYARLFDPALWLKRSRALPGNGRSAAVKRLAALLQRSGRYDRLARIHRLFLADAVELDAGLASISGEWDAPAVPPEVLEDLHLLHVVRIAIIAEIFQLAARVPRFSNQPDITVDEVVDELLRLNVGPAIAVLARAFPPSGEESGEDFGEPASYRDDASRGYELEHREIFEPLIELHDLVRRISAAITHAIGAVG